MNEIKVIRELVREILKYIGKYRKEDLGEDG